MTKVRCAIYTRKSSEEGLEQDFNSLHAQREACTAYVLSQASEGWTLIPEVYDDGGLSGGTLERPALQRLLTDLAAGQIDIIVVYKVDRLTRSLLDFARLVEAFDKAVVSFVSITQSFNTTTSMGRLTLNMLLSFAQFEREVTAERIRDKIAASKARGMWMGGTPPLGYRPDGRSLAIVEEHAALVRLIHDRYLALGNVRHLADQLQREGVRSPVRRRLSGAAYGGAVFSRGQLYAILRSPVYTGHIVHKGRRYPGKHPAILAQDQWDRVQALLTAHVRGDRRRLSKTRSLLAGRILGPGGEPLIAVHATRPVPDNAAAGRVRYRYYVSRSAHHDAAAGGMRIPAREIEGLVVARVADLFADPLALADQAGLTLTAAGLATFMQRSRELGAGLRESGGGEIAALVQQVRIEPGHVEIDVGPAVIAQLTGAPRPPADAAPLTVTEHMQLTRTGRVIRLVDGRGQPATPAPADASLTAMLIKARKWWGQLAAGRINIKDLARQEGVTSSWMTRTVRLAFLSPALVEGVLDGTLKAEVSVAALLRPGAIPADWHEQLARYG